MLVRRVSILGLALLSLGSVVALANPNKFLLQTVAETTEKGVTQNQFRPHHHNGIVQALNLTPEQVQKMQLIRKQYKDPITQTNQQLSQAKQQLSDAIASTAPADRVRAKHLQVDILQKRLGDLRFESTLAVRELLTPEQRIKYVQRMQKQQPKIKKPAQTS